MGDFAIEAKEDLDCMALIYDCTIDLENIFFLLKAQNFEIL